MDKEKLKLPERHKLTVGQLCQGQNTYGDTKDLQTWLDTLFTDRDTRIYVERQFALKLGILSHGLIKWSDGVNKKTIVKLWEEVMDELYEPLSKSKK